MVTFSMVRFCGLCVMGLLATSAAAQSGSGNMMKMAITMKMQMPGMGDMPARTVTKDVCTSKDHDMRAMLQQQKACVVSNYTQTGNTVSYHVVCGGNPPSMSGDAQFELLPSGDIHGHFHANSNRNGHSMVMDMTYAGQRTGSCDYTASRPAH
ncbi:DUF3617 family protein [Rhodanobacter sp. AS-Z3]|uniref:DUF3617 domain-containing protein n=1 Tax=Rhodanobacter sp. AS-Z3 TaxID=3031330 RepID=UPI00247903B6|nr:DUF3617 family protein [Rhodanobacter sp. AS-Z3]WEN15007.1 DUF3617 family protein [Rhodanobacter sp. AS-Z3]